MVDRSVAVKAKQLAEDGALVVVRKSGTWVMSVRLQDGVEVAEEWPLPTSAAANILGLYFGAYQPNAYQWELILGMVERSAVAK